MTLYIVNAFTKDQSGGNPAGVILLEDCFLAKEVMQDMAKLVNLSETAFALGPNQEGEYSVRFFTPTDEVPLCGHATLATFHVLQTKNHLPDGIYYQKTLVGRLAVKISSANGTEIFMNQTQPSKHAISQKDIDEILGCFSNGSINPALPIELWDTGLKDIMLPIKSRCDLNTLNVDFDLLSHISKKLDIVGVHAFTEEFGQIYARNFAPLYGINEESATGTSNGALIAYLHEHCYKNTPKLQKTILQGEAMGATSAISAQSIKEETHWQVWVGGRSTVIEVRHLFE